MIPVTAANKEALWRRAKLVLNTTLKFFLIGLYQPSLYLMLRFL